MRRPLRHIELRRAADAAERLCRRDRGALQRTLDRLRAHLRGHAAAWMLGSGFAAGIIAARLSLVALLRATRLAVDTAMFVRRLPIGWPNAERPSNPQEHPA